VSVDRVVNIPLHRRRVEALEGGVFVSVNRVVDVDGTRQIRIRWRGVRGSWSA
jgi:hypothetical protein